MGQPCGEGGLPVAEHLVPTIYRGNDGGHEQAGVDGEGKEPVVSDAAQPHVAVVCFGALEVGPGEEAAGRRLVVLRGPGQASHGRPSAIGAHDERGAQFPCLGLHTRDAAAIFDQARHRRLCPDLSTGRGGCLEEDCVECDPPRREHRRPDQRCEVVDCDPSVVEGERCALDRRGHLQQRLQHS